MTTEAASLLQDFYLQLRKSYRRLDSTPITTRQLESMIRLVEARAKVELREIVTRRDAEDVIEIMLVTSCVNILIFDRKYSLFDAYSDDSGDIHIARSQMGTGMSRKQEVIRFVARLRKIHEETLNDLFTYSQLYQIAQGLCYLKIAESLFRNEHRW